MAVLIEGLSVVIRRSAIEGRFQGGWEALLAQLPQSTLCDDAEIARVGFTDSEQCQQFVVALMEAGLDYVDEVNGMAKDFVVVDQRAGITTLCDWLDYGHVTIDGDHATVAACRLLESTSSEIVTPREWSYEGSLSERYGPKSA